MFLYHLHKPRWCNKCLCKNFPGNPIFTPLWPHKGGGGWAAMHSLGTAAGPRRALAWMPNGLQRSFGFRRPFLGRHRQALPAARYRCSDVLEGRACGIPINIAPGFCGSAQLQVGYLKFSPTSGIGGASRPPSQNRRYTTIPFNKRYGGVPLREYPEHKVCVLDILAGACRSQGNPDHWMLDSSTKSPLEEDSSSKL